MWTTELLELYQSGQKEIVRDMNINALIHGTPFFPRECPYYLNINGLRSPNIQFQNTDEELKTIERIMEDPLMLYSFFSYMDPNSYIRKFELRSYQKDIIKSLDTNRFNIFNVSRQIGMSRTVLSHVISYAMNNSNKTIKFVTPNPSTCFESYSIFLNNYSDLPYYLKIGVEKFRKGSFIEFENGSMVHFSDNHVAGVEYDYLILSDFTYHPDQDKIWMGVTAYLSKDSRICIYGSPNKSNDSFAKIYQDKSHINGNIFQKHKYTYDLVPNRDGKWEEDTIKAIGIENFVKEYECHFPDSVSFKRSVALYNVLGK